MPRRASIVRDAVTGEEVHTKKAEPELVDLAEAKRRLAESKTIEGRLKLAQPFPLTELGCELMVAAAQDMDIYTKLFGDPDALFKGNIPSPEEIEGRVDRALVKSLVLQCVVSPVLDEEFLDGLIDAHPLMFAALVSFCLSLTMNGPVERFERRLGMLNTGGQELLFGATGGSTK